MIEKAIYNVVMYFDMYSFVPLFMLLTKSVPDLFISYPILHISQINIVILECMKIMKRSISNKFGWSVVLSNINKK